MIIVITTILLNHTIEIIPFSKSHTADYNVCKQVNNMPNPGSGEYVLEYRQCKKMLQLSKFDSE